MGQIDFKVEGSGLLLGEGWDTLPSRLPVGGWTVKYYLSPNPSETSLIDVLSKRNIDMPISVDLRIRGPNSDLKQFGWLSLDGNSLSFGLYISEHTRNQLISLIESNIIPKFLSVRSRDIENTVTPEHLLESISQRAAVIQSFNLVFE